MAGQTEKTRKEIEELRSGLDSKLSELSERIPSVLKVGRKAAAIVLGGGASGSVGLLLLKRFRSKRKKRKEPEGKDTTPVRVNVNVLPKSAAPVVFAAVAIWAGVRFLESRRKPTSPVSLRPAGDSSPRRHSN